MKNALKNEMGSALIMVMIIGGVLLLLISTYATFMYNARRTGKTQETRKEFSELHNGVTATTNQVESISASEQLQFSPAPSP